MSSIGGTAKASQEADNVLLLQYGNPNDFTEGLRVIQVCKGLLLDPQSQSKVSEGRPGI